MIFFLIDNDRKSNCKDYIDSLPNGDKWEVVIQERKNKRSLAQNRLLHMWLPYLAEHFGYQPEQMKDELKYAFIGEETWTNSKGKERTRPLSTTTLTVKEFAVFLNKIDLLARRFNINLPMPDDFLFAMMRD
jgi:hypothetical protein